MRFKKVFSNLELEGQGHGIIMEVTRLLLLGPFYTIQTNFMYFFAHDCTASQKVISSITAKLQIHFKFYIFRCIFFNILRFAKIKEVKINRACENIFFTTNIIHAMDTVLDCAPQVWSY